jgi:phosphatidate cytidylyltransferase
MLLRILSGVIFVPILIVLSRLGGPWFLLLVLGILVLGGWEFYRMMERKGVSPSKRTGVFAIFVLGALVYFTGTAYLGLYLALLILTVLLRELFRSKMMFPIYDIATTMIGVLYVGWLMSHLILLRELPGSLSLDYRLGSHFVLYTFLIVWGCDTGAYFIGLPLGRNKLLPHVSPGKSVEGAIGGFACAVGAALLGRAWFAKLPTGEPFLSVREALALGILLGIAGQLGDLVESLLKRDANIKDASHTIPGHGGILDRFDSLLFAAPLSYYFLRMVVFA